jgi:hypothetical protein
VLQATTGPPALSVRTIRRPMRRSKRRSWQILRSIRRYPSLRTAPHGRTKRVRSRSCAPGYLSLPRKPPQKWESQSSHSRRGIVGTLYRACIALRKLNTLIPRNLVAAGTRKSRGSKAIGYIQSKGLSRCKRHCTLVPHPSFNAANHPPPGRGSPHDRGLRDSSPLLRAKTYSFPVKPAHFV